MHAFEKAWSWAGLGIVRVFFSDLREQKRLLLEYAHCGGCRASPYI